MKKQAFIALAVALAAAKAAAQAGAASVGALSFMSGCWTTDHGAAEVMRECFTATTLTAGHVVFGNPAHDFPKKIMYRLIAPGRLEARIEGASAEDPANQSWSMIPQ